MYTIWLLLLQTILFKFNNIPVYTQANVIYVGNLTLPAYTVVGITITLGIKRFSNMISAHEKVQEVIFRSEPVERKERKKVRGYGF